MRAKRRRDADNSPQRGRKASRTLQAVTLLLAAVLAAGLIGISPLALGAFHGSTLEWERLSFIGQTYGAASAVLSVLALIGVAVTLILQARESKAAREQAIRESNAELLKMAMDDHDLNECWGPSGLSEPFKEQRQQMYINMIISQWEMSYETDALGDAHLQVVARELFSGEIGRKFWENAREDRISTAESRRARRFHKTLDEVYRQTAEIPAGPHRDQAAAPRWRVHPVAWVGIGAGATAVLWAFRGMRGRWDGRGMRHSHKGRG